MPMEDDNLYISSEQLDDYIKSHYRKNELRPAFPARVIIFRSVVRAIIIGMLCFAAYLMYAGIRSNISKTGSSPLSNTRIVQSDFKSLA